MYGGTQAVSRRKQRPGQRLRAQLEGVLPKGKSWESGPVGEQGVWLAVK